MKSWLHRLIAKFIWWRIAGWFGIPTWRPEVTRAVPEYMSRERLQQILTQPLTDIPDIAFYKPKPSADMTTGIKVPYPHVKAILDSLIFETHHFPGTNYTVAIAKEPLREGMSSAYVYGHGHSSCIDPDNFNLELGIKAAIDRARVNAENAIWEMEAYRLKGDVEERHLDAKVRANMLQGTIWPDAETPASTEAPASDWNAAFNWKKEPPKPDENFTVVRRNSDRYGAPLVGEEIELQRGGSIAREVIVLPWVHRVTDEFLDAYTRRPVPGGTTAALRAGTDIDLAKVTNASRAKVFVGDLKALYLQIGAAYVRFPISGGSRWRPLPEPRLMGFDWEGDLAIYADTDFLHTDMGHVEHYDIGSGNITMNAAVTGVYDLGAGSFHFTAKVSDINYNQGDLERKPNLDTLRDLLAALQARTYTSVPAADFQLTIPVLTSKVGLEVTEAPVEAPPRVFYSKDGSFPLYGKAQLTEIAITEVVCAPIGAVLQYPLTEIDESGPNHDNQRSVELRRHVDPEMYLSAVDVVIADGEGGRTHRVVTGPLMSSAFIWDLSNGERIAKVRYQGQWADEHDEQVTWRKLEIDGYFNLRTGEYRFLAPGNSDEGAAFRVFSAFFQLTYVVRG